MMDTMMGTPAAWMLLWVIAAVAIAAVAVASTVLVVRSTAAPEHPRISAGSWPVDVLRRRYAAGEIDEDEYLRRLSGLSQR